MTDSLSYRIDQLYLLTQERLKLQRTVDKMKADEDGLREAYISEMKKANMDFCTGEVGSIKIKPVEAAEVTSYPDLYQYIKETGSFDLLQRRVSLTGLRERWQEGSEVPGVARVVELKGTLGKATSDSY